MLVDSGQPFKVTALSARPQTFADVVGQKHVTLTLRHAVERGQVAHAMLFSGPRGVGKTSSARILAKALNCTNLSGGEPCNRCESCRRIIRGAALDVIEIDAASHNGVDHIRDLREQVRFPPSLSRYKVYVIDEVHMLSTGAFNALLKTLEEPPDYVRFVMATTELHKVPATILSRCQKYRFRPIGLAEMVENLRGVIGEAGLARFEPAEAERVLYYVARSAQGSLRDAQSTLDQVLALSTDKVTYRDVEELLGMVEQDALFRVFECLAERDTRALLDVLDQLLREGKDAQQLVRDLSSYVRNLLVAKHHPEPGNLLQLPADLVDRVIAQAQRFEVGSLLRISELMWDLEARMRWSAESRVMLEVAMLKAARLAEAAGMDKLLARLSELESRLGRSGGLSSSQSGSGLSSPQSSTQKKTESAVTHTAPAAPAPGVSATVSVTLADVASQWPELAGHVPNSRVAGCLSDATPVALDGDRLSLQVPHGFHFHMESLTSPEGRRALLQGIQAMWGCKLQPAVHYAAEHAPPPPAAPVREPDPPGPRDEAEELDPEIRRTLDMFQGKIVKKARR